MDFKSLNWSGLLSGLGSVATVFNPAIGGGLFVASGLVDRLDGVDDDFLEREVIGLTATSSILDKMVDDKKVDFEQLSSLSQNLKSMEKLISKTQKLVM